MSVRLPAGAVAVATSVGCCVSLHAQTANPPTAVPLPQIQVNGKKPPIVRHRQARRHAAAARAAAAEPRQTARDRGHSQTGQGGAASNPFATPPVVQRFQLPNESVSTTAKQIEETVNLKDPEDAIKYFPSLFVRKRNDGDNQAVLATRTWGLNSSARTLIYEDDLLVSALIGNNNSGASPHWNLIVPEAIARVDFLNGPYAAVYPGNSMGGVLLVTTKMPDKIRSRHQARRSRSSPGTNTTPRTPTRTAHQHVGRQPQRPAVMVRQRRISSDGFQQPLTYTTNGCAAGGHERHHRGAEQAGRRRRRGRHRRAHSHAADLGQFQGWFTIFCPRSRPPTPSASGTTCRLRIRRAT